MNKEQRFRILNYRKKLLKQQISMYDKQRELLPVLLLCVVFTILFWSTSIWNNLNTKLFENRFTNNLTEIEVHQTGAIRFNEKITSTKQLRYNSIEYFIYKNNKRLYHFYCDKHESSNEISTNFTYYFRETGSYQIKKRISIKDADIIPSSSVLTGFNSPGNTGFLTLGKWLFLIVLIGFLLLSDYFGKIQNYFVIWERKQMIVKTKAFTLVLFFGLFVFSSGIVLSLSNYGRAGYENDNHAPYKSLKENTTYYVN